MTVSKFRDSSASARKLGLEASSGTSCPRSRRRAEMVLRALRTSWAMPAATSPSRLRASRSRASAAFGRRWFGREKDQQVPFELVKEVEGGCPRLGGGRPMLPGPRRGEIRPSTLGPLQEGGPLPRAPARPRCLVSQTGEFLQSQ